MNPFEKVMIKLFALRQNYKEENNDVMQLLVKLIMNALYGEFLRKDISESYQCKSETWMMSEYVERVSDYQKINYGNFIVKMKDDEGLLDEIKKVNTLPLQIAVFILSNSKRIIFGEFYTNDVYYTGTDSLYIENKHWENLNKAGLVGKNLLQGKSDYKDGGVFYALFLASKINFCLTIKNMVF